LLPVSKRYFSAPEAELCAAANDWVSRGAFDAKGLQPYEKFAMLGWRGDGAEGFS
jgi:hypothetical protein